MFGVLAVIFTIVFSIISWRRAHYATGFGLLELLRILIVALVAITINQPEWLEQFKPDTKPVLAVLYDTSKSMTTKDVIDPEKPGQPPKSRAEVIQPLIDPALWDQLKDRMDVLIEPFSSDLQPDPNAGTDVNSALAKILDENRNLRGVVLATDGDWNTGEPPVRAATQMRMRETPVFAVSAGSDTKLPDVTIAAFDVPAFGIAGKPVRIPFSLESALPQDYTVTVEMKSSDGDSVTKVVTIPAMGRVQDTILWRPNKMGDVTLTLDVPPSDLEKFPDNNTLEAPLAVRKEELRVLVIETLPRWEYRYLRNALERDPGVEVNCLLFHPGLDKMGGGKGYLTEFPGPETLSKYDVIFLGDVGILPDQLTVDNAEALRKQVSNQASGLVFLPGFQGNQITLISSPLEDLLPIVYDQAQPRGWGSPAPGQFELTDLGERSLLTKLADTDDENATVWSSLPGFQWFSGVDRAKAGTEILATHSSESNRYGRIPLIVTKTFGTGKILFMGTDGAWRWRKGVEDKYHYRYWGQVARWMSYQRNMAQGETMRLFYSPDRPRTGEVLTLNANVMSIGGEPLQNATVIVQATAPSGKTESIRLQPGGEDLWGLFTGTFSPEEPGEYQMLMTCAENGGQLETTISVQGATREKLGQPARLDVLEEITRVTRGKMINATDAAAVVAAVAEMPEPELREKRFRLWAHWAWAAFIILLLGVFWVGRKAIGAI
ncbi:MAG: hypothetical protein HKN23_18835 [Verrucomicrobiales bacterium]|nr:hypothetical protein [Verrucomicrobiales bacterium]